MAKGSLNVPPLLIMGTIINAIVQKRNNQLLVLITVIEGPRMYGHLEIDTVEPVTMLSGMPYVT